MKQLQAVAEECRLPAWEYVRNVHVVKSLGQADDDYTPTFVLRRGHLRRKYASELRALLDDLIIRSWDAGVC